MEQSRIRNFCIIAHIDHGKSTLADRFMELTGTVDKREMRAQLLDKMDIEQERGITIKLAPVRMNYKGYELNLIDTPGHVDFSYEVSRSLAAVEGAVLVVDATQGIQAQTLANLYLAMASNLKIVPVINKIDLPAAETEKVATELCKLLSINKEEILLISAKTGEGVYAVLDRVVSSVPSPTGKNAGSSRALIFDSYFDDYRGVVLYVRLIDGSVSKNDKIKMLATDAVGIALETGRLVPGMQKTETIDTGEIGYIVTNLKSTREARVGDTVTLASRPAKNALPGYQDIKPFVYAGIFPESNADYPALKEAVEKLALNDAALRFEPENSPVLGSGLRLGFLGLLHMDIVRERIMREHDLSLIITNPSTDYQVVLTSSQKLDIKSASELPEISKILSVSEPWVIGEIVTPASNVGQVLQLIVGARGIHKKIHYINSEQQSGLTVIDFEAPLANLLTDFYDQLKSITSGYGSFNYELAGYRDDDLVRVDFYIAGDKVDALAVIVHRSEAERVGRTAVEKLKDVIPRQQFKVSLQAGIGGRFIAREDISAFRKDVTAGLYGGDVTRKKKQLAKQKKGKERMKRFGKVDIPSEAFAVMLRKD